MTRQTRRSAPMLLLAAALLANACASGPPPRFYALGRGPDPTPVATRPELGLAVGPLELPRYLDRSEIVTRDGSHRLVLANAHRWGGSLRSDVLRVLADDLGTLLGTARVVVYPNEPRFPVDYRVLLELQEFEGVAGEGVVLRARWMLASGADGRALVVEESTVREPVASEAFEDLVAAHSAALGAVTREIARRLAALPAPPPR